MKDSNTKTGKNLTDTKTAKNLAAALAGESLARNKYSFYAIHAKVSGEPEVAEMFERLALNEMMHAKAWYTYLYGTNDSVKKDLQEAAMGEFNEWHSMYPQFSREAREEGFEDIAEMFERVAKIECDHEMQFMTMLAKLSGAEKDPSKVSAAAQAETKTVSGYRCQFCGAVYETRQDVCSVCEAIGSFEACTFQKKL